MGIFDALGEYLERRYAPTDDYWYMPYGASNPTVAGVSITTHKALQLATVYSCVRVLGTVTGSAPCHLHQRIEGGGKRRATEHRLYDLIRYRPDAHATAQSWFETVVAHVALVGNCYSEKIKDRAGRVAALRIWNPDGVKIERTPGGRLKYTYEPDGGDKIVRADDAMLHIPGISWNGVTGLSVISYQRELLGMASATEEFGSRFFSNGAHMGAVFALPEGARLSPEDKKRLGEDLERKHGGLGKAHKGLLLPPGMTYTRVGVPPEDAQFLETRRFNKTEIAGMFGVPLHLLGEHTHDSKVGSSAEQMNQNFVAYTLRPWFARLEQSLTWALLSEEERRAGYFFEFLADALLRGDSKARAEYFTAALTHKWMTPNEVRDRENLNPVEWGDEPLPSPNESVGGGGGLAADEPTQEEPSSRRERRSLDGLGDSRQKIQRSHRGTFADAVARVIRREKRLIMQGAAKYLEGRSASDLTEFIDEFYESHSEFTRNQVRAVFATLAEAIGAEAMSELGKDWEPGSELRDWIEGYVERFADQHSQMSRAQLVQLIEVAEQDDAVNVLEALGQRFDEWENGIDGGKTRAEKIAERETVNLGNKFARFVLIAGGVTAFVWRSVGDTCPFCIGLDGQVVGTEEPFLSEGEGYQPDGAESPLRPSRDVFSPPCHAGCDCVIIPETGG